MQFEAIRGIRIGISMRIFFWAGSVGGDSTDRSKPNRPRPKLPGFGESKRRYQSASPPLGCPRARDGVVEVSRCIGVGPGASAWPFVAPQGAELERAAPRVRRALTV